MLGRIKVGLDNVHRVTEGSAADGTLAFGPPQLLQAVVLTENVGAARNPGSFLQHFAAVLKVAQDVWVGHYSLKYVTEKLNNWILLICIEAVKNPIEYRVIQFNNWNLVREPHFFERITLSRYFD